MNRSNKRPPTPDIDHRSTKRRKAYSYEDPFAYSTREIPWEEQKKLPRRFHEHGEGFWPALRIVKERGYGKKREYLIEWEPHPRTAEIFAPTWTPVANVNTPLREEWEHKRLEDRRSDIIDSSPIRPAAAERARLRNRRIVSDSVDEREDSNSGRVSAASRTPTAAGSPVSIDSSYGLEIAETQQPSRASGISIDISSAASHRGQHKARSISRPEKKTIEQPTAFRGDRGSNSSFLPLQLTRSNQVPLGGSGAADSTGRTPYPARILEYNSQFLTQPNSSHSRQANSSSDGAQVVHESSPRNTSLSDSSSLHQASTQDSVLQSSAQQPITDLYSTPARVPYPSQSSLQDLPSPEGPSTSYQDNRQVDTLSRDNSNTIMSTRNTRQSPRLQVAVPNLPTTSPRVPVRGNSNARTKSGSTAPEISSPLAATAPEFPRNESPLFDDTTTNNIGNSEAAGVHFPNQAVHTISPANMHIEPATAQDNIMSQSSADTVPYETAVMAIQESIEEEPVSSNEDGSLESKASSSQKSLEKEQLVRQQDGLIMPDYPVLGPDEYCLALPAEGKVQAIYAQTIKVKRKAILKFIRRRGSVNSSGTSATKTIERNDMIELIQRLHDTTTHIDLGLPGIPTQYTLPSSEHAAYAEYAGSKFVFLGCLVDDLMRRDCTVAIMAQPATQDLLEEYLLMKHVQVKRHDRPNKFQTDSQTATAALKVELLSTKANEVIDLDRRPVLVIAFDASFESLNPQVKHMRAQFPGALPVLHLMVTNSSEHVERCLPASMPSPIRLKLLVRATYQAQANLGGPATYVEDPADIPMGKPMDMLEFSKAIRKSPKRKLAMLAAIVANTALSEDFAANWTLKTMPELVLDELEDTPPSSKESRATSVTRRARSQTPVTRAIASSRGRSQTPVSHNGTPNTRKRLLEPDSANNLTKRPRMAVLGEYPSAEQDVLQSKIEELGRELETLRAELTAEKQAREAAEVARDSAERRKKEWQTSLAELQHRYEKRTKKSHQMGKDHKKLLAAVENNKQRIEKLNTDNATLKGHLAEAKANLVTAREDLKSAGGDVAALELAREETRIALSKAATCERNLESNKRDFEFVRNQYQDASNRAVELASQVTELEKQNVVLGKQASDEKRRLKELCLASSSAQHLAKIAQLEQENKQRDILLKRQDDELKMLKRNRGVQTRGSSVQPGSPGPRSRQASPAAGLLAPPSGSRASVLRHER